MLKIFKKKKKSNTCIVINSEIVVSGKKLLQKEFVTENYVFSEAAGKKAIFINDKKELFTIDEEEKTLKEVDLSAHYQQINQQKLLFGSIESIEVTAEDRLLDLPARAVEVKNDSDKIVFQAKYTIASYPKLSETCYQAYKEQQNELQVYTVEIADNEFVGQVMSAIKQGEQVQQQGVRVTSIEEDHSLAESLDEIQYYKLSK